MSSLFSKQVLFARMVPRLVSQAFNLGYNVTFGDAYRDPRCEYGSKHTKHRKRLAIDLNLFRGIIYLEDGTGHHKLHDFWDSIGGGARIPHDLNHYEL